MLFNNFVPDNEADFDFTVLPAPNTTPPRFKSRLGDVLMLALSALAFTLSPLSKAAAVAAVPALTLLKKRKNRLHPQRPERY